MITCPELDNDNGCGQGFHAAHSSHPYHQLSIGFGYAYSHSTRCGMQGGGWLLSHCYKHGEHNLSFDTTEIEPVEHCHYATTSVSCASGRKYTFTSRRELDRHLAYKARKYRLSIA